MADNFLWDKEPPNPTQDVENPLAARSNEHNTNNNTSTSSPRHENSPYSTSKALKLGLIVLAVSGVVAVGVALGLRNRSTTDNGVATQSAAASSVVQESFVSKITSKPDSPNRKKQKTKAEAKSSRSFASGYETCTDLENDITEALKLYIDRYIANEAVSNEMYAYCDPNNANWTDDYYYHNYDSAYNCNPDENKTDCDTDNAEVPWVVTWHDYSRVHGEVFYDETEARAAYDDLDYWQQGKQLYDSSKTAIREYGSMGTQEWCQLETWAYEAQCSGEAPTVSKKRLLNPIKKVTKSLPKQMRNTPAHNPTTRADSHTKKGKRESRANDQQGDGFDQNSQHDGVAEVDKVVSDGTFVYAAYGDVLYAWTAADSTQGVSITQLTGEEVVECSWDTTELCTTTSKPNIQALFLSNSRLTVILTQSSWTYNLSETYIQPAFDSSTKTLVVVFDTSDVTLGSPLNEVGRKEIGGSFSDGRSVSDRTIITINSYLNAWTLTEALSRYQSQYCGLDTASYTELATETAAGKAESFAKQMVAELESANDCARIFQMSTVQSLLADAGLSDTIAIEYFVQVHTFDMSGDFGIDGIIPTTVAGAFTAGYGYSIYLADDFLAIPSNVYEYDYTSGKDTSEAFILGFDLSTEDGAVPYCYRHIPGSLDNNYRMDKWDGHLRITTTTSETVDWNSKNTHKIYVLEIPSIADGPGPMPLVGESENLADEDGFLSSARFVRDKAYISATGSDEIEQLVVVDLSDHSNPRVVGSIKIDGSLSYMQQINIDDTPYIFGIGEETNYSSWESPMKLFLFDVSAPSSPKLTAYLEQDGLYSVASYDYLAARFTTESMKLIIPVENSEVVEGVYVSNKGFSVYDITEDSITAAFQVTHSTTDSDLYCYNEASIPSRSFIFQSELNTVQGNTVITTDLESGEKISELDLDASFNYNVCTPWSEYWYGYYNYEDEAGVFLP